MSLQRIMAALAAACMLSAPAAAADFDARPWLEDLGQVRAVVDTGYANRDWLEHDRGADIDALFKETAEAVRTAGSYAAAKGAFDRLVRRIGDGHFEIDWPQPGAGQGEAGDPCAEFDARLTTPGPASALPGYQPLPGDETFPAGTVVSGKIKVGVIRIAVFGPQGNPALCREALKVLNLPAGKPCDGACADSVIHQAEILMTPRFEARLRQLKAAGAQTLLVDLSDNPGGSEWAEAAARIVSAKPLRSEKIGFVRGPQWVREWGDLADKLRFEAFAAPSADRQRLVELAAQAEAARDQAAKPCDGRGCERLGRAGYATGLVEQAKAGAFAGKAWGPLVFSAAEYPYHDAVWTGSVVVLVNQETWSAAEEFAAILQDNGAASVIGERTGGAGCGHTTGAQPVVLKNSAAMVQAPDCVRFRADGSNEVRGITPDLVIGSKLKDDPAVKAKLIAEKLPAALAKAWLVRTKKDP